MIKQKIDDSEKIVSSVEKTLKLDSALRVSEERYRRVFETAQDGILLLNAKTAQIEDVNPFLIGLLGYSYDQFIGKKLWEIGAFNDTALNQDVFLELKTTGYIRYDDLPLVTKDRQYISVEFVSNVYVCDGIDVIQCNIRDNTKRHIAEIALKVTTRILKILSESNIALLNSKTETVLFNEYCRIAVETGGYRMAWVGLADNAPEKRVFIMTHYGHEDGYLSLDKITWDETEHGNDPTGRALRTGEMQFCEDISIDPQLAPWRHEALKRGYKSSIAVPFLHPDDKMACLTLYSSKPGVWSIQEQKLLSKIANDISFGITSILAVIAKVQHQASLQASLEQTIQVLVDTGEERDAYTAGHQKRVANLSTKIAGELGLSPDCIHGLRLAATIHDLGKMGIPVEILAKPRRLTEKEFNLVKEHPIIGFNIMKNVSLPWPIAQIILQHHERIDGSGYPQGLKGDELLIESRILAVADIVEAMASHRPYRAALGIESALCEIKAQRGITLDALVVDACVRLFLEQGYKFEY